MDDRLIEYLSQFLTDSRKEAIQSALSFRTRYITVCLEDIYQSQNASAVLRSCDCFGIQDVHIVEREHRFTPNPMVAKGTYKWLDLHRYREEQGYTPGLIKSMREKGYRIVATTPHHSDVSLENFDLTKGKVALFMGTEHSGLSDDVLNSADEYLKIPIFGFAESLNISVAAAIIIHHLSLRLRSENSIAWKLDDEDRKAQHLKWIKACVKNSELLSRHFINNLQLNSQ